MKFLVPNYSCLQNPWLRGYRPHIPVPSVLCPQLNLLNPPSPKKIPGYATGVWQVVKTPTIILNNPVTLYYNIRFLWDHRRICSLSLTETLLCGAWLYFDVRWPKWFNAEQSFLGRKSPTTIRNFLHIVETESSCWVHSSPLLAPALNQLNAGHILVPFCP